MGQASRLSGPATERIEALGEPMIALWRIHAHQWASSRPIALYDDASLARLQRILLLRYYSNLTQSQISAVLGVSQMHVSRLLARSFARLRSANRIEA